MILTDLSCLGDEGFLGDSLSEMGWAVSVPACVTAVAGIPRRCEGELDGEKFPLCPEGPDSEAALSRWLYTCLLEVLSLT